jgi:uncharacterized protein YeaO (DUF488 family)
MVPAQEDFLQEKYLIKKENMLKESAYSHLKTLPNDTIKIAVGYPSIFSPSDTLLREFNEIKSKLIGERMSESDARKRAWRQTDFENRYRQEVRSKPDVIEKLHEIKNLTAHKDVVLYCYCGKNPCHRFILIDIIQHLEHYFIKA